MKKSNLLALFALIFSIVSFAAIMLFDASQNNQIVSFLLSKINLSNDDIIENMYLIFGLSSVLTAVVGFVCSLVFSKTKKTITIGYIITLVVACLSSVGAVFLNKLLYGLSNVLSALIFHLGVGLLATVVIVLSLLLLKYFIILVFAKNPFKNAKFMNIMTGLMLVVFGGASLLLYDYSLPVIEKINYVKLITDGLILKQHENITILAYLYVGGVVSLVFILFAIANAIIKKNFISNIFGAILLVGSLATVYFALGSVESLQAAVLVFSIYSVVNMLLFVLIVYALRGLVCLLFDGFDLKVATASENTSTQKEELPLEEEKEEVQEKAQEVQEETQEEANEEEANEAPTQEEETNEAPTQEEALVADEEPVQEEAIEENVALEPVQEEAIEENNPALEEDEEEIIYVDENGNRVDENGNPLDENGNPIVEELTEEELALLDEIPESTEPKTDEEQAEDLAGLSIEEIERLAMLNGVSDEEDIQNQDEEESEDDEEESEDDEEISEEEALEEEPEEEKVLAKESSILIPEVQLVDEDGKVKKIKRKFNNRMMFAPYETKEYYNEIKNYLEMYRAKGRNSSRCETFRYKGLVAKVALAGKSIKVCLALDPEFVAQTPKYHFKDVSDKKQYQEVPVMIKVRSARGLKYFKELVDIMMANRLVKPKRGYQPTNYLPSLIPNGEAILGSLGMSTYYLQDSMNAKGIPAELPDNLIDYLPAIEGEPLEDEAVEASVYLDTLCNHFNDGDEITIDVLKQLHIVTKGNVIKVKARGTLDRKLIIYAEAFEPDALKMIMCTNGTAIKIIR